MTCCLLRICLVRRMLESDIRSSCRSAQVELSTENVMAVLCFQVLLRLRNMTYLPVSLFDHYVTSAFESNQPVKVQKERRHGPK